MGGLVFCILYLSLGEVVMTENIRSTEMVIGEQTDLTISLEAFPEYLIGFPMIVAVTCKNTTERASYYALPDCDLWRATGAVEFRFVSGEGREMVLPSEPSATGEDPPEGFDLEPGESRRMLFDISGVSPSLSSGNYELSAKYSLPKGVAHARPVKVTLVAPEPLDSAIALTLRSNNDLNEPSWMNFVLYNWRTVFVVSPPADTQQLPYVDASRLSPRAKEALAFHFFLHHALYGPKKVGELSVKDVAAFSHGPLEGEASLLRLEVLIVRGDRSAPSVQKELSTTWPGLKWRIDEISQGAGFLTTARHSRGAERQFIEKPPFYPYTGK